jgi:hypothetical protein
MQWWMLMVGTVLFLTSAPAQNLLPNPSFESGTNVPDGWRLNGGVGKWESYGRTGKRCVSVTGNGNDSNAWECVGWKPEGGKLYRIRFFVRRSPESAGGTPITGFSTVNRDAWDVPADGNWHMRQFVCRTPMERDTGQGTRGMETVLRFGQWHVKGTIAFDDIEVLPVSAVHRRFGEFELGSGESIRNGVYRFTANFAGYSSNDSRPLFAHTAGFNTDRWVLGGPMAERWQESGAWVVYRHRLSGTGDEGRGARAFLFETASLVFVIGYYEGGQLVVEVSNDGKNWREVGRFAPSGEYTVQVPNDLMPASEIWVRFWATGVLQVNAYRMEAKLSGNPPDAVGETWYFAVKRDTGQGTRGMGLRVEPKALTDDALLVWLKNEATRRRQITVTLSASKGSFKSVRTTLPPNSEQIVSVPLPQLVAGEQGVTLRVMEGATIVYEAEAKVQKSWIEVGGFGYHIASTGALTLWWCEATYKIGRITPRPSSCALCPVQMEAARNEYEPFQLVLTPNVPIKRLRLRLEPFTPVKPVPSPKSPVPIWDEVAFIDYVPVTIPTDAWGAVGEFPDPLVPLWRGEGRGTGDAEKAIEVTVENLQAGKNQPLWLTVYVPKGVPAGNYRASIQIIEAIGVDNKPVPRPSSPVPIELRVFGFTLPDDTPLRTAYGVHIDNDWHRLKTQEQFRRVFDLYMQTCRRYRISPYTPHAYAPIRWEAKGPRITIDNGLLQLVIDRWQGRVVSVTRGTGQGTRDENASRPSSPVPLGGVLPLLEQFEREGVGWEGKGVEWVGTEVIRNVQFVERNEKRVVVDITAERIGSQPARRKFAATARLTVEAGKPYFAVQLRKIVNTDQVRWRINGYFHLLPPDQKPLSAVNADNFGAWFIANPQSQVPSPQIAFGAAGSGFSYSLRINPATGHPHGDVYRQVGKWLEPNEAWEATDEPMAFVFVWDAGRGTRGAGKREGEAFAESIAQFVERLLKGEITALPESKLQIAEQHEPEFRYDFTEFDAAMSRYIDEFRFNGFNLVILPETLGGYERFTPEWTALYKRLMAPIVEHLKQKGWRKFAYCYWIDEPHTPEQYDLTKRGMVALKEALPGVRRLLTNYVEKFPSPTFYGYVDLWVPILNQFDEQRAKERQALGEEVWWYVCTGPKAPYPNNFIDHPAITHRIRYWMAAKWHLDGDLYWSMTYWRGKGYRLRNPYEDGQSETPEGGYWGNGDGRLLYPPVRQPLPENAEPIIAPPIPSLRLALIAEGIEDYCYFWLLKRLRDNGRARLLPSQLLKLADEAMGALDRLIRSPTDYEQDPKKLHAERRKVAEAIERLANLLGER